MAELAPKKTSELGFTSLADSFVVNRGDETYRLSLDDGALQLMESEPVAKALRAAALGFVGMMSYLSLQQIVGIRDGQLARVDLSDTGSHVDPVSGSLVSNAGEYAWNPDISEWVWLREETSSISEAVQEARDARDAAQASSAAAAQLVGKAETAFQPTNGVDQLGVQINSRRIFGRSVDVVSILDYATSQAMRENIRNGNTGIKNVFDDALQEAQERGVRSIQLPDGHFNLDDNAVISLPTVAPPAIVGPAGRAMLYKNGQGRMFEVSRLAPNVLTDGAPLTADAIPSLAGSTIQMSISDAAQFSAGMVCIARSTTISTGSLARNAEFVRIRSVNYATGVITLYNVLRFSYLVAASARLYPITLTEGVSFENIIVDWANGAPSVPQRPPYNIDEVFALSFCKGARLVNVESRFTISSMIQLHGCMDTYIENYRQYDGFCDGFDMTDAYTYGVSEVALNIGTIVNGGQCERSRHAYTTLTADSSDPRVFNGGHPMYSKISHVIAREMKASAFDVHGAGIEPTFLNCHALGARGNGFQMRCYGARINMCSARDILPRDGSTDQGHALFMVGTLADDLFARDIRVNGFYADGCYGAGIYDQSRDALVQNAWIRRTNLPGIVASGTGAGDGRYKNILLEDVAKAPGGLGPYAIVVGNSLQVSPVFDGIDVEDPNSNLTYLVKRNNDAVRVELRNVFGARANGDAIPLALGVTNLANMLIRGGYGSAGGAVGPVGTVQIISDVLDVSKVTAMGCIPTPETGIADTIATIVGVVREGVFELRGVTGQTITLTHSGSGAAGTLYLRGGANLTLQANQRIRFTNLGGVLFEDWRNY